MYGDDKQNPKKASYCIEDNRGNDMDSDFSVFIRDLEDISNDNIRDVDSPLFESLFGNQSENLFGNLNQDDIDKNAVTSLKTEDEIRDYLNSIGMIEDKSMLSPY